MNSIPLFKVGSKKVKTLSELCSDLHTCKAYRPGQSGWIEIRLSPSRMVVSHVFAQR